MDNDSLANSVGDYDAKTHFPELLERVAAGEVITITQDGLPVARLIPAGKDASEAIRREAIAQMRRLASRNQLRGLGIKDLIAEGRK